MYVPPSSFLPSNKNKNNFETQGLDWKGRAQAAIVDYGLKRFTSGLELKYLEITADIYSCSFFFVVVVVFIKK